MRKHHFLDVVAGVILGIIEGKLIINHLFSHAMINLLDSELSSN